VRLDRLNILIVDDNHHMRVLLTEILRAIDIHNVHEANDGAEALQMMRRVVIDVVLTDLTMSPLDGIDFVRLLRNAADSPNQMTPVIMITGHSTQTRVREARDVGVDEFLVKPITARGLLSRLKEVIENPRPYVKIDGYFGPDRRRRSDPRFSGPWRRDSDEPAELLN
jgi:CheY-like chemotaxis protein